MDKILSKETISKSIKILVKNFEIAPNKIKNSVFSREILKIKMIYDDNQLYKFDNIIESLEYGKTNNIIDYKKEEEIIFENRRYSVIDYRESILILSLLMDLIPNNELSFVKIFETEDNKAISTNSPLYIEFDDDIKFHTALESFNEKLNWLKASGTNENYVSFDIKNAFPSASIKMFLDKLELNQGSSKKLTILKTILERISKSGGIPLFFASEVISRIIWEYVFVDLIKALHSSVYPNSNIVTYVDEVWVVSDTIKDVSDEITKISSFLINYGLEVNNSKIKHGPVSEISKKHLGYFDEFQVYYHTIDELIENFDFGLLTVLCLRVLAIESEYLRSVIAMPWNKKTARLKRESEYEKILDEYEIYLSPENSHLLIRGFVVESNTTALENFKEYLDNYIFFISKYTDFVEEDDFLFYLFLIDLKNLNPNDKSWVINIIKKADSKITSSFAFMHNANKMTFKLRWIYNLNRDYRGSIGSEIMGELTKTIHYNNFFSYADFWTEGSLWMLINQNHFYSNDIFVSAISTYSAASWFYNAYINDEPVSEHIAAEKNIANFINEKRLVNLTKFRHNSPITHTPTKRSANLISELADNVYDLQEVFKALEKEFKPSEDVRKLRKDLNTFFN